MGAIATRSGGLVSAWLEKERLVPKRRRSEVIREEEVGLYHLWVRCVRRAWLCGLDPLTGNDYEHRKEWIESRLAELARIFAIDACVYAVLSNH